jgi:hypothetical protein
MFADRKGCRMHSRTPELLDEMTESLKTVGFFKEGSGGEGRNRTGGAIPYG